ncbi:hypothetical protein [Winogradskyella haliclonae]|uniref:Uncharacterized protein n=1 Tax=Winogradskyella haliclonae TaxID=2048558 RepID=A0ABQ2C1J7_9FLAO|nr:hypothetical protein [Winogradskyella haliclonae]GGI57937.1 hypothetical protein GCM10011444_22460 [Winogradskyella haliclonae]
MKKDKLHNINSTGFKAPKDYFESFDEKLMQRLEENISIKGITATGFNIPKDYFDTVESKILDKVNEENKTKVISLFSRKHMYYVSGIAASLLFLFAIFINNSNAEELSVEMVESYFADSDLDSYELAELLSDADVLEDNFTLIETEYNEENLEEYLLENADIEAFLE